MVIIVTPKLMDILNKVRDRRIYTYDEYDEIENPLPEQSESTIDYNGSPIVHSDNTRAVNNITNDASKISDHSSDVVNIEALSRKTSLEVETMVTYILTKGKEIPEEVCKLLSSEDIIDIIKAHGALSKIIAPSNPETITYVKNYANPPKKVILFSHIPLVRYFIVIAVLAIASLVISGLSEDVNTTTLSKGILNNSGIPLLKNLIFLCSAAGIGTVFFLLSKLTKEVKEATLSKDDTTYYWAMLIMGMLSGLILSEIIVVNHKGLEEQSIEINRLLFALVGGFSSEVVYGILQTVMGKIQGIISSK